MTRNWVCHPALSVFVVIAARCHEYRHLFFWSNCSTVLGETANRDTGGVPFDGLVLDGRKRAMCGATRAAGSRPQTPSTEALSRLLAQAISSLTESQRFNEAPKTDFNELRWVMFRFMKAYAVVDVEQFTAQHQKHESVMSSSKSRRRVSRA